MADEVLNFPKRNLLAQQIDDGGYTRRARGCGGGQVNAPLALLDRPAHVVGCHCPTVLSSPDS
jgi:hypothetical protein